MSGIIGITGASGEMGRRVAARLAAQNVPLRLVVRDASRAPQVANAEVREASSYADAAAMQAALAGVETLFFISGDLDANRTDQHITGINAALAAGVERIVYLSFLGAAPNATFVAAREHYYTEQHIRATGVLFTFLRSSVYMDDIPHWFYADGVIRGPAGNGRVAWVTRDDIADVAAAVLLSRAYDGQTYDNTGSEALTLAETVAIIADVSGKPLRYEAQTLQEAIETRRPSGADDHTIEAWVSSYSAVAAGELDVVSDTVQRIAGHAPQTLREYLAAHPESYAHL